MDQVKDIQSIYQIVISVVDIFIVSFIIYWGLMVVKTNVKTLRIFKGTIIVIVIDFLARFFKLVTLQTITQNLINWGFLVFIIIFQPEIRNFLEKIGKSSKHAHSLVALDLDDNDIDEITSAVIELADTNTGALITIERDVPLQDFIDAGVVVDAKISSELLISLFRTTTPLHDGAIIIQQDKIACANTFFPPPTIDVIQSFGSRHRAAIGISEISDSLTIVVSEETGNIRLVSFAEATLVKPSEFKEALIEQLTLKEGDVE